MVYHGETTNESVGICINFNCSHINLNYRNSKMHLSQYIDKFLLKLCYNSMKPSQSESSFLKGKCNLFKCSQYIWSHSTSSLRFFEQLVTTNKFKTSNFGEKKKTQTKNKCFLYNLYITLCITIYQKERKYGYNVFISSCRPCFKYALKEDLQRLSSTEVTGTTYHR